MRAANLIKHVQHFIKFGLVGVLATAVHMAVFLSLTKLAFWDENLANFIAFLLAVGVSYFGHTYYSFRDQSSDLKDAKQFAKFAVTTGIGFVSNMTIVFVSVTLLQYPPEVGAGLMILITPGIVFLLMKKFVFTKAS